MIGQPLRKISQIPLADDYNRLVEVLQPFQNLTVGQGLNSYIAPNGISISLANQNKGSTFNFPFKVTSDSLSSATIQFGRVFEERNFKGDEVSTITNLSFIELSSSVAFDTTSGMTLDLDPNLNTDAIVIAINASHETTLDNKFYQVALSSDIPADHYVAHVVSNLTKETSSTSWNVEQVLMGDYTFDRNPPVPFDITRYGDKWLIYLPSGSLIINGTDWTNTITNLTYGITPIVGYWYEITNDNYNALTIYYNTTTGYGSVFLVSAEGPNGLYEQIRMWDVGNAGTITTQLLKGAQVWERIRPDSGDSSSVSKSIARQNNNNGIEVGNSDYTIELHGFYDGTEILGTIGDETSYTHKIPIREVDMSGNKVLRWTDVANLSAVTGSGTTFDYPWKATYNPDTTNIDVIIGRVYEYQSFEDSSASDVKYAIDELEGITYTPLQVASITCGVGDFIGIYRDNTYPNKWEIGTGLNPPTDGILLQKICNVTAGPIVEQIHMGDINFNEPTLHAFSVARLNGNEVMYIPGNSIVINGQDYTSDGITNGIASNDIESTAIQDWYRLLVGNFYYISIRLKNDVNNYGSVYSVIIGNTNPSGTGELIRVSLYDPQLRRLYQNGIIHKEIIRTDSHAIQSGGNRWSLSESVTNAATEGDRTMQIRNFSDNTDIIGALDGSGDYSYTILTREYETANDNAEIKYIRWSDLYTQVGESIVTDTTIISEIFSEFWTWYDNLSSTEFSGRGFWEKGENYTKNYGVSIGSNSTTEVIDLTNLQLKGGIWTCAGNFNSSTDLGYQLGESNFRWSAGHIESLYSGGVQVVGNQQAAIPDSDGTLSGNTAAINSILGGLRAHGLIAT